MCEGGGGLDIIFIKSCALPVPSLRNYTTSCMYNNYYGKYSSSGTVKSMYSN